MSDALQVFEKSFLAKKRFPHIYDQGVEGDVRAWKLFDSGCFVPLSGRDEGGRKVILMRIKLIDTDLYSTDDVVRLLTYLNLILLEEEETQIAGVVFIVDQSEIGLKHVLTPVEIRDFMDIVRSSGSVRQKGNYIVNLPSFANIMVELIKMAMNEKLRKRVFVVKKTENLVNYFDKNFLPKEYGGIKPAAEMISEFKNFQDQKRELFQEIMDSFNDIPWNKVPDEKLRNRDTETVGSFRKLEVD